jgi:ketosteroid isomerase-like protein
LLKDIDAKILDDGKYLVLWKKTPGGWKMYRDCFNSNHKQR